MGSPSGDIWGRGRSLFISQHVSPTEAWGGGPRHQEGRPRGVTQSAGCPEGLVLAGPRCPTGLRVQRPLEVGVRTSVLDQLGGMGVGPGPSCPRRAAGPSQRHQGPQMRSGMFHPAHRRFLPPPLFLPSHPRCKPVNCSAVGRPTKILYQLSSTFRHRLPPAGSRDGLSPVRPRGRAGSPSRRQWAHVAGGPCPGAVISLPGPVSFVLQAGSSCGACCRDRGLSPLPTQPVSLPGPPPGGLGTRCLACTGRHLGGGH